MSELLLELAETRDEGVRLGAVLEGGRLSERYRGLGHRVVSRGERVALDRVRDAVEALPFLRGASGLRVAADSASPSFSPTDATYSLYISPMTSASPPNCSSRYTLQHSFISFPP